MLIDDVYDGSTSFLVYVVFDDEFVCGASLISSQNALAPYKQKFKEDSNRRFVWMGQTDHKIVNIEYDRNDPKPDKFAVITVSSSTQNSRM